MDVEEHMEEEEDEEDEEEDEEDEEEIGSPSEGRRNGYRFLDCLKNHAHSHGRIAMDGCGEFMPGGGEGTLEAMICAACSCHRNFHRKVLPVVHPQHQAMFHHHQMTQPPYYYQHDPTGYLHLMMYPPSDPNSRDDVEEISNASPSGSGSRRRPRTKFTQDQKDQMLAFSEAIGWRINKENEAAVKEFCDEAGIDRQVLKVWMHNNKQKLAKKP